MFNPYPDWMDWDYQYGNNSDEPLYYSDKKIYEDDKDWPLLNQPIKSPPQPYIDSDDKSDYDTDEYDDDKDEQPLTEYELNKNYNPEADNELNELSPQHNKKLLIDSDNDFDKSDEYLPEPSLEQCEENLAVFLTEVSKGSPTSDFDTINKLTF